MEQKPLTPTALRLVKGALVAKHVLLSPVHVIGGALTMGVMATFLMGALIPPHGLVWGRGKRAKEAKVIAASVLGGGAALGGAIGVFASLNIWVSAAVGAAALFPVMGCVVGAFNEVRNIGHAIKNDITQLNQAQQEARLASAPPQPGQDMTPSFDSSGLLTKQFDKAQTDATTEAKPSPDTKPPAPKAP